MVTDKDLPSCWSSKARWLFHRALELRARFAAGEPLDRRQRDDVVDYLGFGDVNYDSEDDDAGARARLFKSVVLAGTDRDLARLARCMTAMQHAATALYSPRDEADAADDGLDDDDDCAWADPDDLLVDAGLF